MSKRIVMGFAWAWLAFMVVGAWQIPEVLDAMGVTLLVLVGLVLYITQREHNFWRGREELRKMVDREEDERE